MKGLRHGGQPLRPGNGYGGGQQRYRADERTLQRQRETLSYLEQKWIAPLVEMRGPNYHGAGALYNKLNELKMRTARGEDVMLELGQLEVDAKTVGNRSWSDMKAENGWRW